MLIKYLLMRLWPLLSLVGGSKLSIDVFNKVAQVDPKFLSVAIDSHVVAERWKNFDFDSDRVLNMAKALAPAYLRLGGTAADLLTFKEKLTSKESIGNFVEIRSRSSRDQVEIKSRSSRDQVEIKSR